MNSILPALIFFPEKTFYEKPEDYHFSYEDVQIRVEDKIVLHAWYLKAPVEKGVLLFFHGNAGNISSRLFKVKGWIRRGFSVLLIDYRGYGKSTGKIEHGEDILKDAEAAWDWLRNQKNIPVSKIILYGESLGTHPAIRLGNQEKAGGVILEAPFTSFFDLANLHYPLVPKELIREFEFPNDQYIGGLKAPLFILHGTQDEICPYSMAGELFEKAPEPKAFFSIPGGTHNDLPIRAGEDFWEKPYEFITRTN